MVLSVKGHFKFASFPVETMPATRARSTAPRFNSSKPTPSPPLGTRHKYRSESLSPLSDDYDTTLPLTLKRNDTQQQQNRPQTKPATDANEIIEISDDDDDELPRHSQTSMIADFRRQINKLREVMASLSSSMAIF